MKAVLFDVDDTLFDRRGAQREMPALIVREFGDLFAGIDEGMVVHAFLESDRLATQEFDASGSIDAARIGRSRIFLKFLGLGQDYAEEITRLYVARYPRIHASVRDAKRVVEGLFKRFRLGVVSNGIPDVQYQKLKTLGIEHLFDCIVLSEEVGIRKPDPGIFLKAAGMLAMEPRECLYVGDSYERDVVGAKRAGMLACWFNPDGLLPLQTVQPDFEVRTLEEIPRMLGGIHPLC